MSFFDQLGEYLYANTSTEYADNAATHQEVAAGQSARYNDLARQGKIDPLANYQYQQEIKTVGNMTADAKASSGSLFNLLLSIPWYIWAAVLLYAFHWLGGFAWLSNKGKGWLAK